MGAAAAAPAPGFGEDGQVMGNLPKKLTDKVTVDEALTLEEEYIRTIKAIEKAQRERKFAIVENEMGHYKRLCEAIAMKHLHSKGIYEMPYFTEILEYRYDDELEQYVKTRKEPKLNPDKIRELYNQPPVMVKVFYLSILYRDAADWCEINPQAENGYYLSKEDCDTVIAWYQANHNVEKIEVKELLCDRADFLELS